jgi:hypothetical protein
MKRTRTGSKTATRRGKRRLKDLPANAERTVTGGAPAARRLETVTFTFTVSTP